MVVNDDLGSGKADDGTQSGAKDHTWMEAIVMVLRDAKTAMHYSDLTDEIARRGLRKGLGATPAATVAAMLSGEIKGNGDESIFVRVGRGEYMLRSLTVPVPSSPTASGADSSPVGVPQTDVSAPVVAAPEDVLTEPESGSSVISAFGMYWRRDFVVWAKSAKILGQQQVGAKVVDFAGQVGVYLLHDRDRIIYVGRVVDRSLGRRLFEHTVDRLGGRWDRFSWFGILPVAEDGNLIERTLMHLPPADLIGAFESLLIEALEPPQNRRRGDELKAVEYQQAKDPQIEKKEKLKVLQMLNQMIDNPA